MNLDEILKLIYLASDKIIAKFNYSIIIRIIANIAYVYKDKSKLESYLHTHLILELMSEPELIRSSIHRSIICIFAITLAKLYNKTKYKPYGEAAKIMLKKFNEMKSITDANIDKLNKILDNIEEIGASRKNFNYDDVDRIIGSKKDSISKILLNNLK